MPPAFSKTKFRNELKLSLPASSSAQRRNWAQTILENNISLEFLSPLLNSGQKAATRFMWLVSDTGYLDHQYLLNELPFFFRYCKEFHPSHLVSFASFWYITGVPHENEGEAIDLMFRIFLSGETNVSIRSRALFVLSGLSKKHPELKNELLLCIEEQKDRYSNDFRKRADKILKQLKAAR